MQAGVDGSHGEAHRVFGAECVRHHRHRIPVMEEQVL